MALADELGTLILNLNPYTNQNLSGGGTTGDMDPYLNVAAAGTGASGSAAAHLSQIPLEVEDGYEDTWMFKGEPQKINRAGRFKYRYPVRNAAGATVRWVEDYVLIGFEGSGGGS
jgi:hypothetical protein